MFIYIRRLNTVKGMATLPKLIYRFSTKFHLDFFFFLQNTKIFDNFDKQILKFIKKCNGLRRVKIIFKNNKVDGFTFPNFKTYHKAKATQTVRWCGTGIKIDEWNTRIQI